MSEACMHTCFSFKLAKHSSVLFFGHFISLIILKRETCRLLLCMHHYFAACIWSMYVLNVSTGVWIWRLHFRVHTSSCLDSVTVHSVWCVHYNSNSEGSYAKRGSCRLADNFFAWETLFQGSSNFKTSLCTADKLVWLSAVRFHRRVVLLSS